MKQEAQPKGPAKPCQLLHKCLEMMEQEVLGRNIVPKAVETLETRSSVSTLSHIALFPTLANQKPGICMSLLCARHCARHQGLKQPASHTSLLLRNIQPGDFTLCGGRSESSSRLLREGRMKDGLLQTHWWEDMEKFQGEGDEEGNRSGGGSAGLAVTIPDMLEDSCCSLAAWYLPLNKFTRVGFSPTTRWQGPTHGLLCVSLSATVLGTQRAGHICPEQVLGPG